VTSPDEITFRLPLLLFLVQDLYGHHGHMIGINEALMAIGMCADYNEVYRVTNRVSELVGNTQTIHVSAAKGSDGPTIMRDGKFR